MRCAYTTLYQGIRETSEAALLKAKSNARDLRKVIKANLALKEKVSAFRETEQQLAGSHKAKCLLDDEFATLKAEQEAADKQVHSQIARTHSQRLTETFVRGYMCASHALFVRVAQKQLYPSSAL